MRNHSLSLRLLFAIGLALAAARAADEAKPGSSEPREKTVQVLGSAIGMGEWRPAGMAFAKGEKITLSAEPLKSLGPEPEFRRDSVVFREGKTGREFFIDTHGRATWMRKGAWKTATSRSFIAAQDGELWFKYHQPTKHAVTIRVEAAPRR